MSSGMKSSSLVILAFAASSALAGCTESEEARPIQLVPQHVATDEDVPVEIPVLHDAQGDHLTVIRASAAPHTVEVLDGSIVRVTPQPDFSGTIDVTYDVGDGSHTPVRASATVTVRPVNDPPVASGGEQGHVHVPVTLTLQGRDVEGAALTYEVVDAPAHGALKGEPPTLLYLPAEGYIGDDQFTYRASDGSAMSAPAVFLIHVSANAPALALPGTAEVAEDSSAPVVLKGTDDDLDLLFYAIETSPGHGKLTGVPPNMTYTPDPDFVGDDAIAFSVSDGGRSSAPATITIHVRPVDDAPIATPQSVAAIEDMPEAIALAATDIDSSAASLTFHVRRPPLHGTLSTITGATTTYLPAANYHGPDSFTFDVSDGTLSSSVATVTIDVAPVNDAPTAQPVTIVVNEDATTTVVLSGGDVEGDPITFATTSTPGHGKLGGTPPNLSYTPDPDYNGTDSFTYTVSDRSGTSDPGTVSIQVKPVNDPPVARAVATSTLEDTAVTVALQASDIDSTQFTFAIVSAPSDGTFRLSGANLTYTPARNATGTRMFTFRAADDGGATATSTATATIEITPVNDPPVAKDDYVATDPGVALRFKPLGNDSDPEGDALQIDSSDAPAHGAIEIVDRELVYTPAAEFTGVDVFSYTVSDGHGGFTTAEAHVGVGTFPAGAPTEALVEVGFNDIDQAMSLSNDGRYIAFSSQSGLVTGDSNGTYDVYVYDRGTRTLERISVASGGGEANAACLRPRLSGDGRYVVFESTASNLVPDDANGVSDVFRRDRVTGETIRVSVTATGGSASGASSNGTISDDGNRVAFTSSAFDLVQDDANGASDVFVRDIAAGTTTRVSVSATGQDADLESSEGEISGDGNHVAFSSPATNLVARDTNNLRDVFVRDLVTRTTVRASVSTTDTEANEECTAPSLSHNGQFIAFLSEATNLVLPATFVRQLYVRNNTTGPTTTRPPGSRTIWGRLSGDGRYATEFNFDFLGSAVIVDRFAAKSFDLSNGAAWSWPVISGNGRYIAVTAFKDNRVTITVVPNPL